MLSEIAIDDGVTKRIHRKALFDPGYLNFGCAIIKNGSKYIFVAEYAEDFTGNAALYKQIYIRQKSDELLADKFVTADFTTELGEEAASLEKEEHRDETKMTVSDACVTKIAKRTFEPSKIVLEATKSIDLDFTEVEAFLPQTPELEEVEPVRFLPFFRGDEEQKAIGLMAELMSSGETFDTLEASAYRNIDADSSVFSYSRFNNTWNGAKVDNLVDMETKSEAASRASVKASEYISGVPLEFQSEYV